MCADSTDRKSSKQAAAAAEDVEIPQSKLEKSSKTKFEKFKEQAKKKEANAHRNAFKVDASCELTDVAVYQDYSCKLSR